MPPAFCSSFDMPLSATSTSASCGWVAASCCSMSVQSQLAAAVKAPNNDVSCKLEPRQYGALHGGNMWLAQQCQHDFGTRCLAAGCPALMGRSGWKHASQLNYTLWYCKHGLQQCAGLAVTTKALAWRSCSAPCKWQLQSARHPPRRNKQLCSRYHRV